MYGPSELWLVTPVSMGEGTVGYKPALRALRLGCQWERKRQGFRWDVNALTDIFFKTTDTLINDESVKAWFRIAFAHRGCARSVSN